LARGAFSWREGERVDHARRRFRDPLASVPTSSRAAVFGEARREHLVVTEEAFGQALAAWTFEDKVDAGRLAKGTSNGLVAGVWTREAIAEVAGRQFDTWIVKW
jgi:acyl-CoA reductase-like NAD-dependent aldehyde dehydrogenase